MSKNNSGDKMISEHEKNEIINSVPEEGSLSHNGRSYTQEDLEKLADSFFNDKTAPAKNEKKNAEILLGAVGSGKTYNAIARYNALDEETKSNTIYVSYDEEGAIFAIDDYQNELRENVPDYVDEQTPVSDESLPFRTQNWDDFRPFSQRIRNQVLKRALDEGYNLIIDTTSSGIGSVKLIENVLKPLGYDNIKVTGTFAPLGKSVERAHNRVRPASDDEIITKRIGDPEKNQGALNMLKPLIEAADRFEYYYNPENNNAPRLAFTHTDGKLTYLNDDIVVDMKNHIIPDLEAIEDYLTASGYKEADLSNLETTYEQFEALMLDLQEEWEDKNIPTLNDIVHQP